MNLLTDEECKEVHEVDLAVNYEAELCTGKKHNFPKDIFSFERKKKKKTKQKEQEDEAKKAGIKEKPTKYLYNTNKKYKKIAADISIPKDYPYKWFLGGSDACQGDSGGPMWRNVKGENNTVRAFQIGVVSRGSGCASFNKPGIYGSIKYAYPWIKETIEKEMKGKEFCPK